MKKYTLLLIFACLLLACSDDDGGGQTNPNVELLIGTWDLSELIINPAQDIDEDGTSTTNILEELPCISGQFVLQADNRWTFSGNDVIITTITGGLFKFFCSDQFRTGGGNWDVQGNVLRLADGSGVITQFVFDPENLSLTNTIGEDLPGLQAEVYEKQ